MLTPTRMLAATLFATLMMAAGCGGSSGSSSNNQGILLLTWTVRGQPPTTQSCDGIALLDLVLTPQVGAGSVEIMPIDCTLTRFRYDMLPEGNSTVDLTGEDATGATVVRGSVAVTLDSVEPSTPFTLDLE